MNEIQIAPEIIASLVLSGDISKLTPTQKVQYYNKLCENIGLDPLTQPFRIIKVQGKEILYADKGATQQLCKIYKISTEVTKKEKFENVFVVTVRASDPSDRFTDEDGAVSIENLKGEALANALMKAITKAKRRAVLAFCGLGILDETEIEELKNGIESQKTVVTMPKSIESQPEGGFIEPILNESSGTEEPPIEQKEPLKTQPSETISKESAKNLVEVAKMNGYTQKELYEVIFTLGYTKVIDILKQDFDTILEEVSIKAEDWRKKLEEIQEKTWNES